MNKYNLDESKHTIKEIETLTEKLDKEVDAFVKRVLLLEKEYPFLMQDQVFTHEPLSVLIFNKLEEGVGN